MSEMRLTVDEIVKLMDKMKETGLGELKLEDNSYKLLLAAKKEPKIVQTTASPAAVSEAQPITIIGGAEGPTAIYTAGAEETADNLMSGNVVEAPIVGTFYAAPAPDKDDFVKVGQQVKKGDVLFIIESMKLMNEVQSEFDGEVVQILVENAAPVEYGQPIMVIK